jgi:hypothetical protein
MLLSKWASKAALRWHTEISTNCWPENKKRHLFFTPVCYAFSIKRQRE